MKAFDLTFPATSANLGPGFDTLAIALDFGLRVRAQEADTFSISARGRDTAICGATGDNMLIETYRKTLATASRPAPPLALELDNQIPVGKGCGSSAAARLAGVALAATFGDLHWTPQLIFEAAADAEGHPDNVAACWWGGMTVAGPNVKPLRWLQVEAVPAWPLLLVVPPEPLATSAARKVLPLTVSHADAVANQQNTVLLLLAWQQGRADVLGAALHDRLHQPFREPLCPLLPALQPLAGRAGVLGSVLSGAGPSVLVIAEPDADLSRVKNAVADALASAGMEAEIIPTSVAERGPGTSIC